MKTSAKSPDNQPAPPEIKYLFEPRGVAVIGASSKVGKVGHSVIRNILSSGYDGKIYPINPHGGKIEGLPVYKDLQEIDGPIDLATIVIPAKFVFDAVIACAEKQVKFLSIITSGFSEVGNIVEEEEMVAFANKNGMRILGPNIFGIYSAKSSLNATFGPAVTPGNVAIITQSGALGIAMIGKTQVENIGLSSIISIGNKSDIDEADLIEYLVEDDNTKVIFMYIEGIKDGKRLTEVLQRTTKIKPVVVIKSGRSKRGAMAAASHTGSLAGADDIFSDVMKQSGVHRAKTIQEALDWCKYLGNTPRPTGENTVIITNGGGVGVLAADACEEYDVNLFDNIDTLKAAFLDAVPDFGSVQNPIDITGGASMTDYENCIRNAFNSDEIHSIICLGCETALLNATTFKTSIEKIHHEFKNVKPVVYSFVGGKEIEDGVSYLKSQGVPIFTDIYNAISCLGVTYTDYRNANTASTQKEENIDGLIDEETINQIITKAQNEKRSFLLAHEAKALMEAANVPMPQSYIAQNLKESIEFAEKIKYPVVMKIVSKDILHKSDAGGVALDLQNKSEVMDAYEAILHNCSKYDPHAVVKGIEVCEMVTPGTETIIGARIDEIFGPTIMFGLGGIYVEVMKDVSFRALPLQRSEVAGMMKEIRSYPLLLGVRGEEKKDIDSVIDVIIKVGAILQKCPEITDIEVNPLIAYDEGDGVKAVDARILIK